MPTIKNNLISGGLVIIATAWTSTSLNAQYTFIGDGNWSTGSNWSHSSNNGEVPGTNLDEQAVINGGSTVTLNSTIPDVRAFRLEGGSGTATLNIEPGASFEFDTSTNWDSSIGRSGTNGVVNQSGGDAVINFLELGRDNGLSGEYYLSGGELDISRVGRGVIKAGLIIATHDGGTAGGTATGLFEISGGSFTTRGGAWLGGTNGTANATFRPLRLASELRTRVQMETGLKTPAQLLPFVLAQTESRRSSSMITTMRKTTIMQSSRTAPCSTSITSMSHQAAHGPFSNSRMATSRTTDSLLLLALTRASGPSQSITLETMES